ncbi:hypothetical protein [Pseudomonas sp. PONIH3]|uniref:hypothetical protein n=1 Tax=Pseudomonas sp. PONIH3 TaxID=1636610 RepID=UPI003D2ACE36
MDYPKRIPNVGLVGGKFVDENATTGQPGSLIPAAWGNAVSDELLNVIKAAGLTPSEDNNAQLLQAIQGIAASDLKQSVRVATTGPIALSGLQTIDGIALPAGARVLVKDQANAAQNGIYVASANAWVRAQDANENAEFSPGFIVAVQAGAQHGGSLWQFKNQMFPTVGGTDLTFGMLYGKTGVAAGDYRRVSVDTLGRVTGGSNPTTLDGYGITDGLKRGEAGLGVTKVPKGEIDMVGLPGGFYSYSAGGTTFAQYSSLINLPYVDDRYSSQIGLVFGGAEPKLAFRICGQPGVWGSTRYAWHDGNFDPAAKADKSATYTKTQTDEALRVGLEGRLSVVGVSQQRPRLASSENTGDWRSTGLELREVQQVGEWNPAEVRDEFGPGISFHWGGKYGAKLHMDVAGVLRWNGNPLATLNNPVFVGVPQADTAPFGTDTKQIANTSFVQSAVRNAAAQALGVGQTWQDVRASRAANVTYTNTSGRPIMVTLSQPSHLGLVLKYTINGLEVMWSSSGSQIGISDTASFLVPHGSTYSSNFLPATWLELR